MDLVVRLDRHLDIKLAKSVVLSEAKSKQNMKTETAPIFTNVCISLTLYGIFS